MSLIPTEKYGEIITVLPILCVDVVIQNAKGEYLLVKRNNEPKKGHWWPVGGRVLKGETLEQAVIRKVKEETSLDVSAARVIGYFELITDANPLNQPVQYHTVSVVFSTVVDDHQQVRLDEQSMEWKYDQVLPVDFYINRAHLQEPGKLVPHTTTTFGEGKA
jgi:colanic acid biosynthesis protein WcaH